MNTTVINNAPDPKQYARQALRKRRLGMAAFSYLVPFALLVLFRVHAMIPLKVVFHFTAYGLVVNLAFLIAFHTRTNLKFREPSLTAPQMIASFIPALWVMQYLESGQARGLLLLMVAVPLMYGILALHTRQFVAVGALFLASYLLCILMLLRQKPEVFEWPLEFVQAVSFFLVVLASSVMGGFIYNLRAKIRERNRDLQIAMAKIEALANADPLTGVFNRRRLFEALAEEAKRYKRSPGSLCVCLMDIDHFKQVNDGYGHHAGDEILRDIACHIAGQLRRIDSFGRYGGEEFTLVLPQTTLEGASIKAEKLRREVAALRFPTISKDLRVTVSIGVVEYRNHEAIDATVARSDKCLYLAKDRGRNRVVTEKELE